MELQKYIKEILSVMEPGTYIDLEINLYADTTVSDEETGNKIKFTLYKKIRNIIFNKQA